MDNNKIQSFENKKVRSIWDAEKEEWFFSVVDVVAVLTDSENPTDYLKKMRKRDNILGDYLGTNCPQIDMMTETGKMRKTLAANPKQLLRIIQSIPSKKAEPFKLWLAQIGSERLDSSQNPELTIELAMKQYKQLGYNDEWSKSGVKEGLEYAILTNLMSKEWSGKTIADYKKFKNLKKESLRDNMTSLELVLNMLAEATTSEIHKNKKVEGLEQSKIVAKQGAGVAKTARIATERLTGKPVVNSKNAKLLGNVKQDTESGKS